jgi:glycosyltransferase involved in cell wall biosynthesis
MAQTVHLGNQFDPLFPAGLRELQDETGGFTAFITWSYQPDHTELAGSEATGLDYLRTLAIARNLSFGGQELAEIGGRMIEGMLSRPDTDALLAACDCYASLHRSEGFGFTLAEAMLLGKPTVATGYSANLDFMTMSNSHLVNHRMIQLETSIGPYPTGARWAEPDINHAANLLRQVFERRDEARELGLRAKRELEPWFAPVAAARRIAARLKEIQVFRGKEAA